MPTDFRTVSLNIPTGTGRRTINSSVTFNSNVVRAAVVLNGFKLDYANEDHHINLLEADTDINTIIGRTVRFRVEANYADKNFDDPYSGFVSATVIAEVA
jgi:hypothetical protein